MPSNDPFYVQESPPMLIVISGPSGVGKDAVLDLMKEQNVCFYFVITATSRPKRDNEQHGVDYFFVTQDEFERMIAQGEFIEHALVYGEYKGIPKWQVQEAFASGKDVIMRIDVQGANSIRKLFPEALLIFLTPGDEAELERRLRTRKTESEEKIAKRIATARQEMQYVREFDYLVENKDGLLDETVKIIKAIIQAEHHRVQPRKVNL